MQTIHTVAGFVALSSLGVALLALTRLRRPLAAPAEAAPTASPKPAPAKPAPAKPAPAAKARAAHIPVDGGDDGP
ncbi:MAG: hypothetical protein ABW061_25530, partial [Polyangiaceae bacterium]